MAEFRIQERYPDCKDILGAMSIWTNSLITRVLKTPRKEENIFKETQGRDLGTVVPGKEEEICTCDKKDRPIGKTSGMHES